MSRLSAEYSPEEHHDIDRVSATRPATGRPGMDSYRHFYVCCCGDLGHEEYDETAARAAHDQHRADELGLRD